MTNAIHLNEQPTEHWPKAPVPVVEKPEPYKRIMVCEPIATYGLIALTDGLITEKVRFIRGQKVMLDRDLAELYGVEVKRLKEQVRRNMDRFPEAFMFELTLEEAESSRSHFATLKQGDNIKYLPFAFTEHGILMAANVLKSKQAIAVSIRIIDLFVRMREVLMAHKDILLRLEQLEQGVGNNSADIQTMFHHLKKTSNRTNRTSHPNRLQTQRSVNVGQLHKTIIQPT